MNAPSPPEKATLSHLPKLLDLVVAKIRFKHYSRAGSKGAKLQYFATPDFIMSH